MADKVSLTAAVRANLLTLQHTADLVGTTQTLLSTSLKVNSAIDDASAFFTSRALTNRASDLDALKSDTELSVSTIHSEIERASCRERVWQYGSDMVVGGSLKQKKIKKN